MKKTIEVAAACIENENREILCALRSHHMSLPNKWEFPGGKIKKDETAHVALQREISEELDCKITTGEIICEHTHEYDTFIIHIHVIQATIIEGTLKASEHAKLIWLSKEHLDSIVWAPADIPAVEKIMKAKRSSS
ncbi:(deoxy)nucleoside triphosphate pyrophosphohydrolase [Gracilibacillus kekensis]|uniref:8-oxo-dGTP diphosphatase n=1 Tax=Gracilibacillus kekensis TaxID=1027249 RepID=A0A1M7LDW4_9BACI|nr:(deoxy)nucleoside triphosphate pyrophosphohydrolase [Gracilibacillus kekensis]SHM76080.1 8-oxo-dGTP diphosphatase [Gracilibacillus kekensis]